MANSFISSEFEDYAYIMEIMGCLLVSQKSVEAKFLVSQQCYLDIQLLCHFVVLLICHFKDKYPYLVVMLDSTSNNSCEVFFPNLVA